MSEVKETRKVTNEDIKKYVPMVNKYLRDNVVKNWNEATLRKSDEDISLGNTGMSLADIKQHLFTEVVVALQKYNPDYRTAEGMPVKESTFVFQHLFNRTGQLMKRLTKRRYGYGIWQSSVDDLLNGNFDDDQ
jgi:hypothetical protein